MERQRSGRHRKPRYRHRPGVRSRGVHMEVPAGPVAREALRGPSEPVPARRPASAAGLRRGPRNRPRSGGRVSGHRALQARADHDRDSPRSGTVPGQDRGGHGARGVRAGVAAHCSSANLANDACG